MDDKKEINRYRKVPDDLLDYVKEQLERVEYGSVLIKVQGNDKRIDIISEDRQRFDT